MADRIREAFLTRQLRDAMQLNEASDVVTVTPIAGVPPERYVIDLRCRGLVQEADGTIRVHDRFAVGLHFPEDYTRSVPNPFQILTVLHPMNAYHPNVSARAPFICVGHLPPGTGIIEIAFQVWEIWTYRRYNLVDGLNADAALYARAHRAEFPVDPRPLKRRAGSFTVEAVEKL